MPAIFKKLLFFLILGLTANAFAQVARVDVVYLKNGSIIKGKILENIPGKTMKIETTGNNIMVLPMEEITKVAYDESSSRSPGSPVEVISSFEFMGGNSDSYGGVSILTGHRFPSGISTGLGFGFEVSGISLMPLFGDVRYSISGKGRNTPFLYSQAGYAIAMSSGEKSSTDYSVVTYKGGFLAGGGIGIQCNLKSRNAFVFSVGYRYQRTKKETRYEDYYGQDRPLTEEVISRLNRIMVSVGFLFN